MKDEKLKYIEEVLVEADPVGLICMGAPLDEYSYEALLIYERTCRIFSLEKIHQIIYDVFISRFENIGIGTFDSYKPIAEKINAKLKEAN